MDHENLPLIILISLRANLQLIWSWKLIFFIATCLSHSLSIPANTSPLAPYPMGRRSVNREPTLKLLMNWVLMLRGSLLGAAILTNVALSNFTFFHFLQKNSLIRQLKNRGSSGAHAKGIDDLTHRNRLPNDLIRTFSDLKWDTWNISCISCKVR